MAALAVSSDWLKGTPEAVAAYLSALYPTGKFLQGTLVASSQADLPNAPQANGVQAVPATLGWPSRWTRSRRRCRTRCATWPFTV